METGRDDAIALATRIRAKGLRLNGIHMQGHFQLRSPALSQIEASILAIHEAGLKLW